MRKLLSLLLCILLSFSVIGCSGGDEQEKATFDNPKAADLAIYKPCRSAIASADKITALVDAGNKDELLAYCEQVTDWGEDWLDELEAIEYEGAEDYISTATGVVSTVYMTASDLLTYHEDGDTEALHKASKNISIMPEATNKLDTAREAFLTSAGLTNDEVAKIVMAG